MKLKVNDLEPEIKVGKIVYADKLDKPTALINGVPNGKDDEKVSFALVLEQNPGMLLEVKRMVKTAHQLDGVGIAANQIGVNKRMFVIATGEGEYTLFLHPSFSIVEGESTLETAQEGCLSVPKTAVNVPRNTVIKATWFEVDETGQLCKKEEVLQGRIARVFQHELDHLLGRSILDYSTREIRRNKAKYIKHVLSR